MWLTQHTTIINVQELTIQTDKKYWKNTVWSQPTAFNCLCKNTLYVWTSCIMTYFMTSTDHLPQRFHVSTFSIWQTVDVVWPLFTVWTYQSPGRTSQGGAHLVLLFRVSTVWRNERRAWSSSRVEHSSSSSSSMMPHCTQRRRGSRSPARQMHAVTSEWGNSSITKGSRWAGSVSMLVAMMKSGLTVMKRRSWGEDSDALEKIRQSDLLQFFSVKEAGPVLLGRWCAEIWNVAQNQWALINVLPDERSCFLLFSSSFFALKLKSLSEPWTWALLSFSLCTSLLPLNSSCRHSFTCRALLPSYIFNDDTFPHSPYLYTGIISEKLLAWELDGSAGEEEAEHEKATHLSRLTKSRLHK